MGGEKLTNKEKRILASMAEALTVLPDEKKEYLLGFAEGAQAMDEFNKGKKEHPEKVG